MPDNESEIADILAALFQSSNREGIEYCVLRDYEGLPKTYRSDVDFLVNPADRLRFQDIILNVAADRGWVLAKHVRKFSMWQYFFYPAKSDDAAGRFILQLDLFYNISWKGIALFSSQEILQWRTKYHEIFVPNANHEATILLLKDLLSQGRVFPKYRVRVPMLIEQDPDGFRACGQPIVGQQVAKFLLQRATLARWDEIEAGRNVIRLNVVWRAFTQAPMAQMIKTWRWAWGHLRQPISYPAGSFIVVLGSDGCGKTTVIYELMPLLEKLFTRSRRLAFNFNTVPHILGDLRNWIRRRRRRDHVSPNERVREGPRLTPFPTFRALAHLAYHTVGFLLGYPLLFVTRRRGELIIVERYFYDYFVQPSYARIPRWLLKAVLRLLPKPDAVIYLHGDAQLIHDRKPELPVNEIERQEAICRSLLLQAPNGHMIDVSASVSATARQIAHVVCQVIEGKQGQRP